MSFYVLNSLFLQFRLNNLTSLTERYSFTLPGCISIALEQVRKLVLWSQTWIKGAKGFFFFFLPLNLNSFRLLLVFISLSFLQVQLVWGFKTWSSKVSLPLNYPLIRQFIWSFVHCLCKGEIKTFKYIIKKNNQKLSESFRK